MADLDAASLGQRAQLLGLVKQAQIRECYEDLEQHGNDAAAMVRVLERKGYLTPWQSQKLLKGDNDGYFLGGYRLLYKISSGSFGRVFRADDPDRHRRGRQGAAPPLERGPARASTCSSAKARSA